MGKWILNKQNMRYHWKFNKYKIEKKDDMCMQSFLLFLQAQTFKGINLILLSLIMFFNKKMANDEMISKFKSKSSLLKNAKY